MFKMIFYFCIILFSAKLIDARIGINWGRQSVTTLVPSMVVDLLLQNEVHDVKLFNIDDDVIRAFSGTDIGVTLCIPKVERIDSYEIAKEWVTEKVMPFRDVNIRYVQVGNNAFGTARFKSMPFNTVVTALRLVQRALDDMGFGSTVQAVLTHGFTGVIALNSTKPSEAAFVGDVNDAMNEALSIINVTNAPFYFDLMPIAFVGALKAEDNFAFSDNKSKFIIKDVNGLTYNNIFDYAYDCFVWALKKAGFGNMKIVVSQIGWPTDGFPGANVESAERFWKALLPLVSSNRGTPMRPGEPIDIYVHSLVDEKNNPTFFPFMRHWGIYRSNGEPKYKIDLSGRGRDIYPTKAKGISLMPARWCVFNGATSDPEKITRNFEFACKNADCTSLAPGGSCGHLTNNENISYAFNSYFQSNFQDEKACKFEGLGSVVIENPSRDTCVFIVEVVKGNTQPVMFSKWG